jgi:type 1 glutamine amidotransferase
MFFPFDRVVSVGCAALCLLAGGSFGQPPATATPGSTAQRPARVLIICGEGDHDWRATAPFLRGVLEDTGRFEVRVCESPAGLSARSLEGFDVLVDHYGGPALGTDTDNAIAAFVESGKGLVVTHGALGSSVGRPAATGGSPPAAQGLARGVPEYWPIESLGAAHTPVDFLEVTNAGADHPILRGAKSGFVTADSIFRGITVRPGAIVLATARENPRKGGGGAEQPVLVAAPRGKGRALVLALGHDLAAMRQHEFIAAFARATQWAATGAVSLPANLGPPGPADDAVRSLLITGGHDHETAFYALFDGYNDLAWIPVASSATAFQSDLRGKYDVLIMYDFSRELDESGKRNLREFVESGHGVVVLHHALLNYQSWPWWYQEVVGGSYRLAREGNVPSSAVKADQEMLVTASQNHPITSGIAPFRIVDESYSRMRFSPRIKPLLTTDNPHSDHTLAWIGPFARSRVVAIQLGHGHTVFGHPSYRALVHNAILWAAGRIN